MITMYLQRLARWRVPFPNLTLRQPVLTTEDTPIANNWVLGMIVELHPGKDGHVRVVTVHTRDVVLCLRLCRSLLKRKLSHNVINSGVRDTSISKDCYVKPRKMCYN